MWYGLTAVSETPAHAWTVHAPGKDVELVVVVRVHQMERVCGAVSRHQHDATADDLLALLNAVIAGAVFSESMPAASAYAARQCNVCSRKGQPGRRVDLAAGYEAQRWFLISWDVSRE